MTRDTLTQRRLSNYPAPHSTSVKSVKGERADQSRGNDTNLMKRTRNVMADVAGKRSAYEYEEFL